MPAAPADWPKLKRGSGRRSGAKAVPVCFSTWPCRRVPTQCCAWSGACRCPSRSRRASWAWMTGRCARGAPTARSSWTWTAAACWTFCRTARPRRWRTGCEASRRSRWGPATARPKQVADRWHVLVNLRQAVERWLAGAQARLRRLPPGPSTSADTQPGRRTKPFARTRAERAARVVRRERWVALYEEVRRRHAAGEALQAISRAMNLAVGTVRKYASAESFPVPEGRPLRRSILDPYLAHLQARLAEGCENALTLWRELRAAGFPGTAKQVQRWVAEH